MNYRIGMLDCQKSQNSEAFIVKTESKKYMIDTGYKNALNAIKKLYKKICGKEQKLDYLIISHGDDDHCSAMGEISRIYTPNFIIFSPLQIHKHVLLEKLQYNDFDEDGDLSTVVSELNRELYKRYFRVISTKKLERTVNGDIELPSYEDFQVNGFDLEIIEIRNEEINNLDIIVVINNDYLKEKSNLEIRQIVQDVIVKNLDEFQTYDTGQVEKIEKTLNLLINDVDDGSVAIKNNNEGELIGFLKRVAELRMIEYTSMPKHIDKEQFIKIFKSKVLKNIDNAMSLIVRINDILFTGDAEKEQINTVARIISSNSINIIKVPHHGSVINHSINLYHKFKPRVSLLKASSKTNNRQVIRDLLDKTNTQICNSSYFKYCTTGIILDVNNSNVLSAEYSLTLPKETALISDAELEVAATKMSSDYIQITVL